MAWGGPSSVPLGSILYLVFTATESLMTCVKSCENCFQVVCRVGCGTWAEAWVWVGKHKGKRSYKTRTWALEERWTSEHYKSAGLVQGSIKTTGGSLRGKSPLTKPLNPCGSGQSKEKTRKGQSRSCWGDNRNERGVNCQECELKSCPGVSMACQPRAGVKAGFHRHWCFEESGTGVIGKTQARSSRSDIR